jgi:hypothetical protein
MNRCSEHLCKSSDVIPFSIKELSFSLAGQASKENATWARFYAVHFPAELTDLVNEFWGVM